MNEVLPSPIQEEETVSPIAESTVVVPSLPVAKAQAERHNYALGQRSPGVEQLVTDLASGGEDDLRFNAAADEDARMHEERQNLIKLIAKNSGGKLGPEDLKLMQHIAVSDIRNQPDTILEKKFGQRLVNDLAASRGSDRSLPANQEVEDIAAVHIQDREWHQNQYHKLAEEYKSTGWLPTIYDYAEHFLTGLPSWWRLRHALSQRPGVEFLLGSTMEQNVQYLWSLPSARRRLEFQAAMEYLKPRSMLDAMAFAQAMVSFPSSEQFAANFVTAGDYTILGSMAVKAVSRMTRAGELIRFPKPGDPDFVGPQEVFGPFKKGPYPVEVKSPLRNPWEQGVKGSDEFPPPEHRLSLDLNPATKEDPSKDLRVVLAAGLKASHGVQPNVEHVLAATGNVEAAGTMGMVRRMTGALKGTLEDVADALPSFAAARVTDFYGDAKYIAREYGTRLAAQATEQSKKLLAVTDNATRVPRMTAEQLITGQKVTKDLLELEYGNRFNFSDHIVDWKFIPAETHFSNVDTMIARLGESNSLPFKSPERAKMFQKDVFKLTDNEAYIGREGDSYFVETYKHIPETADQVRAVQSPENMTPVSMLGSALRWMKSTADLVAPFQRRNRLTAQHAMQGVRFHAKELEDTVILGLPRDQKKEMFSLLEMQRDMPQTANPSKRGVWSNTAGEFEQAFIEKYGKPPTAEQTHAYDTYKRLNDFDWLMRNSALYRDKARQGTESWKISNGTDWFNGIWHEKFPWEIGAKDKNDAGIYFFDAKTGEGKFYYKSDLTTNPAAKKGIDEAIKSTQFKVVQVADPKKHPLEGFAKTAAGDDLKDQVNYVVSNVFEKRPLQWEQLDYNPGAHVIYPHKWYVAIPLIGKGRLGKLTYYGDNVALNVSSEAAAKMWAERIDTARQLARLGDPGLEGYVQTHLPMTMQEFRNGWIREGAPFSMDHPVVYKEAGHNTLETTPWYKNLLKKDGIVDSTRNPHDPSAWIDNAFVQDRDLILNTVDKTGKRLVPAEQLDPYAALHRALNQSLRNVWMNDYKISAMEQLFQQFGHLMKPSVDTLMSYPTYFLYNPQWEKVASNQWAELGAAKAAQKAIINFLGAQSEVGGAVKAYETQVQNLVFKLFGEQAAGKMDTNIALGALKDPFDFMRRMAYHTQLGMFNPGQLLTQMAQMNHAIAVTGVQNGLAGISASVFMAHLHHNPAHLNAYAKMATKFGWTEKEFKGMWEAFQSSGLSRVAGEAVLRNELDPPLIRSKLGHFFFDIGPMFFNEGERMSRFTGFAAAYRQLVRGELKGKTLGAREQAQIMDRADLLTGNMTRATAAGWQGGIAAVPSQFFAWQARMVEQMAGGLLHDVSGGKLGVAGRLTGVEKARALATYSLLFGAPIGISPMVGGWPLYDSLHKEAAKRRIDLSNKWIEFATDGLYATALHWATGRAYNIPQKFGPGNNQALSDILLGDKSVPELLLGASGTMIGNILKGAAPFYYATASAFTDTGEYKLMPSDFVQAMQVLKTADNVVKAHAVLSYGQWITRNGAHVTEAEKLDAVAAMLGITPKEATLTFLNLKAGKELKAVYEAYEKQAFEDYRLGAQAIAQKDFDAAAAYHKRALALLEMGKVPWDRRNRLFHRAAEDKDLRTNANWQLYMNSRTDREKQSLEYYQQNYRRP